MRLASEPDVLGRRRSSVLGRAAAQLQLGFASALLTAAIHLALIHLRPIGYSVFRYPWASPDELWMLPAGYVLVFLPLAALMALIAAVRRDGIPWHTATGVWIAFGTLSILLLFTQMHGYASMVLAAGLGTFIAPRLARREDLLRRLATGTAVGLGAVAVAAGVWQIVVPLRREAAALQALPPAPPGASNVLLIILDTVRESSTGLGGGAPLTMPAIARRATGAVVFEQAYATAPWTMPSHASVFTGRHATETGVNYLTPLSPGAVTLAEVFRAHGWATGGFTGNVIVTGDGSGLEQGFITYRAMRRSLAEIVRHTTITQADLVLQIAQDVARRRSPRQIARHLSANDFRPVANEITHQRITSRTTIDEFLRWQGRLESGRPWFAFLNLFDAHTPYLGPGSRGALSDARPNTRSEYENAIRRLDLELERLLQVLERSGALAHTIVVITSDHGEQFGEHGRKFHGNSLYEQVLHVPLIFFAPGEPPARVSQQVSLRNLPRTLLTLADVAGADSFPGTSLVPLWRNQPEPAGNPVLAELDQEIGVTTVLLQSHGPMKSVVNDSLHIIRDGDGRLSVFRYRSDVFEEQNLVVPRADTASWANELESTVRAEGLQWRSVGRRDARAWPWPAPP